MDEKADLVRLAFRLHALCAELEELDRLLNEVVAPGLCHACAEARTIQAQLRELAGVERIDIQAAIRAVDATGGEMGGSLEPAGRDAGQAAKDDHSLL